MDKGSLIFYIKTNDIYKDIAENGETSFKLCIGQNTTKSKG